ncbi:unnamed protein product [Danaus chrysippus]|uniref:(African queen) hypothetical protein n=1 Tax=Danaus chrysippus TaxID=151541 RepID=A0A8J2QZ42_9NEOP|nr:unnamed protein product [Danaus chrysippus]
MSSGRGRGYSGRHHLREARPGDTEDEINARTLAELSPRATVNIFSDTEVMEEKDDDNEDSIAELLHVDEQFAPLLILLEQFSPGEDGIQFNRKLRHFETTVTSMCPDEARLQQAFASFRAAALCSAGTCRRLAAVGASFTRQQRQQLLRTTLLNVIMQGTFTKLEALKRSNPIYLINAANLMGDYFAEARLCNGNKVHILASPLLQYMRALLASDDLRAHRSLATQLMQNGRELLSVLSQELDELSISIRLRLLSPPPVSIIWLLLSADLCLNKFLPLPNTLQQFYAAHLDLTTDENFSEVSYGSWKKNKEEYRSETETDKVGQNMSQININQDEDTKPKLRPILGAGAGLLRQEQLTQDSFETWTKSNLTKRYDLNSWRQTDEQKEETETVFNPTVMPPNMQNYVVPDYPPPNFNYQENYANYLQQGDGAYIQNFNNTQSFSAQEYVPQYNERPDRERINNEVQKTSNRRPIENWRKEKPDKDDAKNKNWTRQISKDNINDDSDCERLRSVSRSSRDSRKGRDGDKTPPRKHVTDVPKNHKYWDHDDRCDKDYNS